MLSFRYSEPTPAGLSLPDGVPEFLPYTRTQENYMAIDSDWQVKQDFTQTYTVTVDELNQSPKYRPHPRSIAHSRTNRRSVWLTLWLVAYNFEVTPNFSFLYLNWNSESFLRAIVKQGEQYIMDTFIIIAAFLECRAINPVKNRTWKLLRRLVWMTSRHLVLRMLVILLSPIGSSNLIRRLSSAR